MGKQQEQVIPSCGCVFCDLYLDPADHFGTPMHAARWGEWVPCTKGWGQEPRE